MQDASNPPTNSSNTEKIIQLAHGGGGTMQGDLIRFILEHIPLKQVSDGVGVDALDDGATIPGIGPGEEIVVTADGHTVDPVIFPGGDLGKLAACGTINDLIMMGSRPVALTSVLLIEEGTDFALLDRILTSFGNQTHAANVAVLAGDTKVMPKGTLKGIVMATSGVGIKPKSRRILDSNCRAGTKLILTGSIGDHGTSLMARREGIALETTLESDVAALVPLLPVVEAFDGIIAMKDPTRGGLASALNELATKSRVSLWIDETQLLVKPQVQAVADILGLDPIEISNEGKALLCVTAEQAGAVLNSIQKTEIGKDARIIGEVRSEQPGRVFMQTAVGGTRIIEMPIGEPIPRVC
jgi:hydrogenase expression/formation protein HypE